MPWQKVSGHSKHCKPLFFCYLLFLALQDGQLKAVVGASGGAMIIAATAEILLNHFARRMDPLSSVLAPRSYHQVLLLPPFLSFPILAYSNIIPKMSSSRLKTHAAEG